MDVVKKKKKQTIWQNNKFIAGAGLLVVIVVLSIWANESAGSVSVERRDLLVEPVLQGDLEVQIEGYGTLRSDKQQLITTLTRATVKEIVLKPGAAVQADSVIVRLENPELVQQYDNAKQELAQLAANLRQLKLTHQREHLNESANLSEIEASHETASLRRAAEEKLHKQGIVSQLAYQETRLNERQLAKRIEIFKQRIAQLKLVQQEAVNIQNERIKQQEGQLRIAQERLDKLEVRAGFDGVLQRLSVELGQSLAAGQEIALIGSVTDLLALIRVPQSQAQQIEIGQSAIIDTRRDKIMGTVVRIDPIVENNTVIVEIDLPQELPASARPHQNVDGTVIADTLLQVKYIKRPANVKSYSQISLYKVDAAFDTASLQELKLGRQAGQYIEIVDGAEVAEQFIISDLSNLKDSTKNLEIQ